MGAQTRGCGLDSAARVPLTASRFETRTASHSGHYASWSAREVEPAHAVRTQRTSVARFGGLPNMSMPILNIFAVANGSSERTSEIGHSVNVALESQNESGIVVVVVEILTTLLGFERQELHHGSLYLIGPARVAGFELTRRFVCVWRTAVQAPTSGNGNYVNRPERKGG
jgi:hypothetical protein